MSSVTPSRKPPTFRASLRSSTAAAHGRVDAFFTDGLHDDRSYRVYLRGMQALVSHLDRALSGVTLSPTWSSWRHPLRARWLADDLVALRLDPLPPSASALSLDSEAAAAGALYVIEGSAMGARLLAADVAALGHLDGAGASFLCRHMGEPGRWQRFVACLEDADFDAVGERGMRAAAAAVFACAEQEFTRARAMEKI